MLVALLAASGAMAKPLTKVVLAGPPPQIQTIAGKLLPKNFVKRYSPDINAFFNKKTTVHVGDTVSFQLLGFHTVDFPGRAGRALPLIIPGSTPATAVDAAGNPFWFDGKVPNVGLNPGLFAGSKAKAYDGSQRWDSGLPLGKPHPFRLTFTKAGTYKYFCDVHPGMIGTVVVKRAGAMIPSAKQDVAAAVAQATADVKAAARVAKAKQPANTVSLGESTPGGVELYTMFPNSLTVKPGTIVTFRMSRHTFEIHTATFGNTATLKTLAKGFEGANFPAPGVYPSDPPPGPVVESPNAHGDGFANVGALDNSAATPLPSSGKIKFTTAGTYHFICLIHPQMRGTIIVK
ncbi:MAG: plastocyanin/azurin family copper-binding protein [Solirubrobacteraceae bacterium]